MCEASNAGNECSCVTAHAREYASITATRKIRGPHGGREVRGRSAGAVIAHQQRAEFTHTLLDDLNIEASLLGAEEAKSFNARGAGPVQHAGEMRVESLKDDPKKLEGIKGVQLTERTDVRMREINLNLCSHPEAVQGNSVVLSERDVQARRC
jgi:hypothetical protein